MQTKSCHHRHAQLHQGDRTRVAGNGGSGPPSLPAPLHRGNKTRAAAREVRHHPQRIRAAHPSADWIRSRCSSTIVPPMVAGVIFPVIRRRLSGGVRECMPSRAGAGSRTACRFAARNRSSMHEEARHSLIPGTDGNTWQADVGATAVLTPATHSLSGIAGGIGIPVLGCKFASRDLSWAILPPHFQMPSNLPTQTAVRPLALCSP